MDVVYRRCAGLDVHKKTVRACVRILDEDGRVTEHVRGFGTLTHELVNLRDWLSSQGVTHVAMESTGVYWKPVWNVLEQGDIELVLCNAQHVKNVPGHKTDVKDCAWLAGLLQHGLLKGSFVPSRSQRELRDLTRTRAKLTDEKTRHVNRLQKILEDTNVKLSSVASDTFGASGRAIIEAILGGESDPKKLAELARGQLRGKIPQLRFALEGKVTEHHRYMLGLHYGEVQHLESVIADLDTRIARLTGAGEVVRAQEDGLPLFPGLESDPPPEDPGPPTGGGSKAAVDKAGGAEATACPSPPSPPPDSGPAQSRGVGSLAAAVQLLCGIPGIRARTAENVLAETGDDMSRFPTADHLTSWAGLAPGNNESAGKRKSGKTTKGNRFLRRALSQAAWAASRTKGTYYSALYRRLVGKRGKKRAIIAVARSILVAIYHMLERGSSYEDLGDDFFDRLNHRGVTQYHLGRLKKLGYHVTIEPAEGEETEAAA